MNREFAWAFESPSPTPEPESNDEELIEIEDPSSALLEPETPTTTTPSSNDPKQPDMDPNCSFPNPFEASTCEPSITSYSSIPERLQFDDSIVPTGFNTPNKSFQVIIPCGHIDIKTLQVFLVLENTTKDVEFDDVTESGFRVPKGLPPGIHFLGVSVERKDGFGTFTDIFNLAFGELKLPIRVLMPGGSNPAINVTASVSLTSHPVFKVQNLTNAMGWADFVNAPPGQSLTLEIVLGDMIRVYGVKPSDVRFAVRLEEFGEPSKVDNFDFSLGLEGWDVDPSPGVTQLIDHDDKKKKMPAKSNVQGITSKFTAWKRDEDDDGEAIKKDMKVNTLGMGTRHVSYTAKVPKGYGMVEVNYMFLTYEFPEYFGQEFDDSFSITITSKKLKTSVVQGSSMNALGREAFESAGSFGYTDWMAFRGPVSPKGDVVKIILSVANVADGKVQSSLIINKVRLIPLQDNPPCSAHETYINFPLCTHCVWGPSGPYIGKSYSLLSTAYRKIMQDAGIILDDIKTLKQKCSKICTDSPCQPGEHNCMGMDVADAIFDQYSYPTFLNIAESFVSKMPPNVKAAVADLASAGSDALRGMTAFQTALQKEDYSTAGAELMKTKYCASNPERCEMLDELPGPGYYEKEKKMGFKTLDETSVSKRGYGVGFASKSKRFHASYEGESSAANVSPAQYNTTREPQYSYAMAHSLSSSFRHRIAIDTSPTVASYRRRPGSPFKETSAFTNMQPGQANAAVMAAAAAAAAGGTGEVSRLWGRYEAPGPGTYDPGNGWKKKGGEDGARFVFKSRTRRSDISNSEGMAGRQGPPPPGAYDVLEKPNPKAGAVAAFKATMRPDILARSALYVPGPGSYELHQKAFGNHKKMPLKFKSVVQTVPDPSALRAPSPPGPGHYQLARAADRLHPKTHAARSIFVSSTPRFETIKDGKNGPGPGFYRPLDEPRMRSFHLNMEDIFV
ncbi:hypothetical protein HDU97_001422 [Phlyctochytrium planicorne]|nr:hypothetical protein HDU97_001422 [Phlyctochytrium planicorne]